MQLSNDSFKAGFDASYERFNRAELSGKIAIITGAKPGINVLAEIMPVGAQ